MALSWRAHLQAGSYDGLASTKFIKCFSYFLREMRKLKYWHEMYKKRTVKICRGMNFNSYVPAQFFEEEKGTHFFKEEKTEIGKMQQVRLEREVGTSSSPPQAYPTLQ